MLEKHGHCGTWSKHGHHWYGSGHKCRECCIICNCVFKYTWKINFYFCFVFAGNMCSTSCVFSMWTGLALVLTVVNSVHSFDSENFYLHSIDGEKVSCSKCTPGYFFKSDCTIDTPKAFCMECPDNTFIPNYTLAHSCSPCSKVCSSNNGQTVVEVVTKNCTKISDIVCECINGFFREPGPHGVCRRWSPCRQGYGVVKPGNYKPNLCSKVKFFGSFYFFDPFWGCLFLLMEFLSYMFLVLPNVWGLTVDIRAKNDIRIWKTES